MQKKILIVEDDNITALDLKFQVESNTSFVAETVSSGEEALSKINKQNYDLILMDILLKGDMTGIEAAKIVHKEYQIPVIYVTGNTDLVATEKAQQARPAKILIKPIIESQLIHAVRDLLG